MSFPEAIFSFVFGDGDPNAGFDEARWRALGQFIQDRGGVVTAEEMAAFLDPPPDGGSVSTSGASGLEVDDSFVLPALLRFGGEPLVDESGHLLYSFPSLQKRAGSGGRREFAGRLGAARAAAEGAAPEVATRPPAPALEAEWLQSAASLGQTVGAVALGGVNVAAVWFLADLLSEPTMRMYAAQQGLGWIAALLPFLQLYAGAFFTIPAVRWVVNQARNARIAQRNAARETAADALSAPLPRLRAKLDAARRAGVQKVIAARDIVFSSDKEVGGEQELAEFDRRLQGQRKGK
eukprot:366239-Chlamydomonas_euryale.AAC.8